MRALEEAAVSGYDLGACVPCHLDEAVRGEDDWVVGDTNVSKVRVSVVVSQTDEKTYLGLVRQKQSPRP